MSTITTIIIEPTDAEDPERLLVDCARMRYIVDEARWVLVDLGDWRGRQARIVLDMPASSQEWVWAGGPELLARQLRAVGLIADGWRVIALDRKGREVTL
jgi:hypothetical protein